MAELNIEQCFSKPIVGYFWRGFTNWAINPSHSLPMNLFDVAW